MRFFFYITDFIDITFSIITSYAYEMFFCVLFCPPLLITPKNHDLQVLQNPFLVKLMTDLKKKLGLVDKDH